MKKSSEWTLRTLLGIVPGCRSVWSDEIGNARCNHTTDPIGVVIHPPFYWMLDSESNSKEITIPDDAYTILPASHIEQVQESGKPLTPRSVVVCEPSKDNKLLVQVGSGSHHFLINF